MAIGDDEEAIAFGIEEFLSDPNGICLIEWSQRLQWLLPEVVYQVNMNHVSENEREIILPEWKDGL